jgi:hypothetical protein
MSTKLLRYKYTIYWHKFTHLIINSPNNKLSYFVAYVAQAHYGGAASHQFHPRGAPTRLCNAASTRRVHRPPPSVPLAYYKRGYLAGHRHRSAPPRLPATPSARAWPTARDKTRWPTPPALPSGATRASGARRQRTATPPKKKWPAPGLDSRGARGRGLQLRRRRRHQPPRPSSCGYKPELRRDALN